MPRGPSTQWATTGAPDAFCGATSVRRGSGTHGANPGPLRHSAVVRLCPGDPAPSGPPLGPLRRPVERNGGPGKGRNLQRRNRAPGLHAHGNANWQVVDGPRTEVCGQQKQSNDPRNNQHNPNTANTGRCWRANGTACHIQHSPSTHQPLGSTNGETTPAGAPAAAADRKQRPDATCERKNG